MPGLVRHNSQWQNQREILIRKDSEFQAVKYGLIFRNGKWQQWFSRGRVYRNIYLGSVKFSPTRAALYRMTLYADLTYEVHEITGPGVGSGFYPLLFFSRDGAFYVMETANRIYAIVFNEDTYTIGSQVAWTPPGNYHLAGFLGDYALLGVPIHQMRRYNANFTPQQLTLSNPTTNFNLIVNKGNAQYQVNLDETNMADGTNYFVGDYDYVDSNSRRHSFGVLARLDANAQNPVLVSEYELQNVPYSGSNQLLVHSVFRAGDNFVAIDYPGDSITPCRAFLVSPDGSDWQLLTGTGMPAAVQAAINIDNY